MEQPLQQLIDRSKRIVFFGGAGVSTESGIPDFRSANGLYQETRDYSPEEILSHTFFELHPEAFFHFYRSKMLYLNAKPNAAHYTLARLEQERKLLTVITQNIDGLHQAAGSHNVLELHGSVHRNYCTRCTRCYSAEFIRDAPGSIPLCSCGGIIKPDVVLYEESLNEAIIKRAAQALRAADLLLVAGTSLNVYPAAGMVQWYGGQDLVLINRDTTALDGRATLLLRGNVGEILGSITIK